jgi:formamidopyrimidine-DNA glycosylase
MGWTERKEVYLLPELPEVETICRILREGGNNQPSVIGRSISSVQVLWDRTIALPGVDEFSTRLVGKTIKDVSRRGKFLIIVLSQDVLLMHLRMSGDVRFETQDTPPALHDRLLVNFSDGFRLVFNDTRKFGRVWLVRDIKEILGNLGPEPFDAQLTPVEFFTRLHATRRQLKPLLLDQSFLAGLGNIYTDESLHMAHLHPLVPANKVLPDQAERLLSAIRQALEEGIRHNGASIDWVYRGGGFQNYFRVYDRAGKPCPVCGAPIERIVVGQRGTHYCPNCQPLT